MMYLDRRVSWFVVALLAASPALHMVTTVFSSGLLYFLAVLSVMCMAADRWRNGCIRWPQWRRWAPLMLTSVLFLTAILLGDAVRGVWHSSSFEKAVRFAMIVPLMWLFGRIDPRILRHVQWGLLAGALFTAGLLIFPPVVLGSRPHTSEYSLYNAVGFGAITLLFAFMALLSMGWRLTRFTRGEAALKLMIALIAVYGSFRSETRTVLLALPGFALILLMMQSCIAWRWRLGLLAVLLMVAGTAFHYSGIWQQRMALAVQQAQQCEDAPNTDSSICIRVQLGRAALDIFKENPVLGVGAGRQFAQALKQQALNGTVSQYVADNFGETHNDYLFMAVAHGLVGLLAFALAFLIVPGWYFVRRMQQPDRVHAWAAAMGLALVLGFASFGLTEMMFRGMRTVSFYTMLLACLLALSWHDSPAQRQQ